MGDISAHFSRWEVECSCGCRKWIYDTKLLDALEDLRCIAGDVPITINSWYRCPERHREIYHEMGIRGDDIPFSYHTAGMAADIVVTDCDPLEMLALAEQIPAFKRGGIGLYPPTERGKTGFIHVDVRCKGEGRWSRIDGEYHNGLQGLLKGAQIVEQQRQLGFYSTRQSGGSERGREHDTKEYRSDPRGANQSRTSEE